MANKKQTSKKLASTAGKILQDEKSSTIQKTLAAWILSQASSWKETWKDMEQIASDVLKSNKYSKPSFFIRCFF